ncbi:hypothetical protein GCM10008949_52720 [Deinococcus humi]|nr:hypothetical protein GCM10008949_52720 [Deinococcus humi]
MQVPDDLGAPDRAAVMDEIEVLGEKEVPFQSPVARPPSGITRQVPGAGQGAQGMEIGIWPRCWR